MSLPVTGNRTLAAAQRVSRADVLSIQDGQIAGYRRGMTLSRATKTPALLGHGNSGGWPTVAADLYRQAAGMGEILVMPLKLPVGSVLTQIEARIRRPIGLDLTATLYRMAYATLGFSAVAGFAVTGGLSNTWITLSAAGTHTIESGYRYIIEVASGQSGDRCLWTRATWYRP